MIMTDTDLVLQVIAVPDPAKSLRLEWIRSGSATQVWSEGEIRPAIEVIWSTNVAYFTIRLYCHLLLLQYIYFCCLNVIMYRYVKVLFYLFMFV